MLTETEKTENRNKANGKRKIIHLTWELYWISSTAVLSWPLVAGLTQLAVQLMWSGQPLNTF